MRTRIAVISVLFGLALLVSTLVRYITARDVQRQELAASQQGNPAMFGLLVGGIALVVGGAAALARWSRPAMTTLAGMILISAAGITYLHASDVERQEQAVVDQRWEEIQRATKRFPPALPGGRPASARLRGMPVIICLLAGGVVLFGAGLMAVLSRSGRPLSPQ
jgi:hypothetical protein